MTTGNKIMWKRGEIAPNFSSLPHYFIYIFLTSGVKLHIHLLNVVVQFIVFVTLSTLIYRGTDHAIQNSFKGMGACSGSKVFLFMSDNICIRGYSRKAIITKRSHSKEPNKKKSKRKVQGVPQSQTSALPRH